MFKFSEIYKDKIVFIRTNVPYNDSTFILTEAQIIDEDDHFIKIIAGNTESYLNKSNILQIKEM